MLNIGVGFNCLSNPVIVDRIKLLQIAGDAIWCLANGAEVSEVYEHLDAIGVDLPVVFGEDTCGFDINIGCQDVIGGRNVSVC